MKNFFLLLCCIFSLCAAVAQTKSPRFHVIALYENGGHHIEYSKAARVWLDKLAADSNFSIDYIQNTDSIDDKFLSNYQLFIQLDYAPYAWKEKAVAAFEKYITEGRGGWIGFHHATLLGEFDGYPMWDWFHQFMGNIKFKNYIATFAKATVDVEDNQHPVMKGVSPKFTVEKEEWYTYDQDPRPNVHVLATVDESTYKARNVYIFMGHSPILFDSKDYRTLFTNAIFWAAAK